MPQVKNLLSNFRDLNNALPSMKESIIAELLERERKSDRPRKLVLERLHQRLCILRSKRERKEIMKECGL